MLLCYFIFGAIIGSFLTVCIFRIPYGREPLELNSSEELEPESTEISSESPKKESDPTDQISINSPPRSFCPKCKAQLMWYHNIPIVSWTLLGGRCAYCREKISMRYPLVELLTAILSMLSFHYYGLNPTGAVVFIFCATLLTISFIDYDYFIIPNVISLPGFAIALIIAGTNQFTGWFAYPIVPDLWAALWGILAGAGFLLFVSEVYLRLRKKEGLGMGDVKLLAMTGALLGVPGALYTIFLGSFLGSIIGITLILIAGRKMSQQLPFGPYLALGTIVYIFLGNEVLSKLVARLLGI